MFITSWQNQQTSLSAGVFDGRAHQRIDQLLEDDFTRHRFRDLDHSAEVKLFNHLRDPSCGSRRGALVALLRVGLIHLPHLAESAPSKVGITRLSLIDVSEGSEAARRIKARSQFERQRLLLNETVVPCRSDRLLVQVHGLGWPAFDTSDLR